MNNELLIKMEIPINPIQLSIYDQEIFIPNEANPLSVETDFFCN